MKYLRVLAEDISKVQKRFFLIWIIPLLIGPNISFASEDIMRDTEKRHTLKLARAQWVTLENGLKIQFVQHGHKHTMVDGPSSPLLILMKFQLNGDEVQEQFSVRPQDNEQTWTWKNYEFELIDYVYDESMTLSIIQNSNSDK